MCNLIEKWYNYLKKKIVLFVTIHLSIKIKKRTFYEFILGLINNLNHHLILAGFAQ